MFLFSRAYRSISYTLDGNYLLAGGRSKYISLYNINEQILVKRFEITCNKSFDGLNVRFYNYIRKIEFFGFIQGISQSTENDRIRKFSID